MFVQQLENKNQFVIYHASGIYYQSYNSLIAKIDRENELTIYENWDYSKTTLKHFKIFLMRHEWLGKSTFDFNKPFKKQIEKYIKNGDVIKGW